MNRIAFTWTKDGLVGEAFGREDIERGKLSGEPGLLLVINFFLHTYIKKKFIQKTRLRIQESFHFTSVIRDTRP